MNMGIWVVGTSNHLFIRDSYNETKFSKKTNKLKSDSHLPKTIFWFASMIALQKWWEMLFISS